MDKVIRLCEPPRFQKKNRDTPYGKSILMIQTLSPKHRLNHDAAEALHVVKDMGQNRLTNQHDSSNITKLCVTAGLEVKQPYEIERIAQTVFTGKLRKSW